MENTKLFLVFDVESVGLHGEGFAVGFVVVDREFNQLDCGRFACSYLAARGNAPGFQWCAGLFSNLAVTHDTPLQVREAFWCKWREWSDKGALMAADCAWPVEARFLNQCVEDHPIEREWLGPYPLLDLAPMLLQAGIDPTEKFPRLENELPEHDPLCDARQSARLFLSVLNGKPNLQTKGTL
jgi:hypothetical protein